MACVRVCVCGRGGASPFCPITQEPDFSQTCSFHQKKRTIDLYSHAENQKKQMKTFLENPKKLHFDQFWPLFVPNLNPQIYHFIKNPASSVCAHYCSSTSCQVSLRFYDQFLRKTPDRRTNGRTNERGPIYRTNLESVGPKNEPPNYVETPKGGASENVPTSLMVGVHNGHLY